MRRDIHIDRPIFIVGCQRSGTSIFYRTLASHPELAWFSNFTEAFPGVPFLAGFSKLFPLRQTKFARTPLRAMIPKPREGVRIFGRCISVNKEKLSSTDILPEDTSKLLKQISNHLRYHRRGRFLNKGITNSFRVGYLKAVFPDAIFLHVVRDPQANVASILNWDRPVVKYPKWAWKSVSKRWLNAAENNPGSNETRELIRLASNRWVDTHEAILAHKQGIKDSYQIVNYEEFVTNTYKVMSGVTRSCELNWSDSYQKVISRYKLTNMNDKYSAQFSKEDLAIIREITNPVAERLRKQ